MFSPSHKNLLIAVLVACFFGQTELVYTDRREAPLSQDALRGRQLYHRYACQVCHQLYGQGGFLGPDLTNVWDRVDSARLRSLLTLGSGQMPPLRLQDGEVADVAAFLREIDRPDLGRGQLRLGTADDLGGPQAAFEGAILSSLIAASPEAEGFAAVAARPCSQCHVPLQTSIVGAPDLTEVAGRLSLEELRAVLADGRPQGGMPPSLPPFQPGEVESVVAYLRWLGENRSRLESGMSARKARDTNWTALPWWEFR